MRYLNNISSLLRFFHLLSRILNFCLKITLLFRGIKLLFMLLISEIRDKLISSKENPIPNPQIRLAGEVGSKRRIRLMKNKVYAQLYSMLRTNQKNLIPVLKTISEIGYDGVELMGTYTAGMSIQEYKQFLNDLKLDPISSHNLKDENDFAFAQELGIRHTDIRADLGDYTRDDILKACEEMNRLGKIRKEYGIHAVLHNHSQEFRWVKGEEGKNLVYDLLISYTDPEYVGFEFDVGWGAFSGADPVAIVKKYPGRFPLLHVKEANRTAKNDDELEHFPAAVLKLGPPMPPMHPDAAKTGILADICYFSEEQAKILYSARDWNCRLGEGIIDWKSLVAECEAQGTVGYISEREYYSYPGGEDNPAVCARQDYEYLRSL